ncbi:MBL fold metallo-hydrolase [Fodinibius sediminis]|uniref:Glyoxylase, beta-lactamase superfamily II n=1 Tax=Fodinibius sediminis TaxID=1214077 RepID=A0A521DWQ0_9BACT|nr:MBL fold metallo-hydrolase [Fodinibius sediminis]SMO76143.1 Glyoxylase, beta-lactamase superfamily II [Fodinibius sediminis]
MKIGSLNIELLSEGKFEIFNDGHINRSLGEANPAESAGSHSAITGINPVLVQQDENNILLDAGLGWGLDAGSSYTGVSNVRTNLAIFGLSPEDITHVILSHLHYDHALGCSFTDRDSVTRATFPNATYYLHKEEWAYALSTATGSPSLPGAGYQLDEFYRLMADRRVQLLSGETTDVLEGITLVQTGGHTPGHHIVFMQSEGEHACYPGELIPSSLRLNHYDTHRFDYDPIQAKQEKIRLLRKVYQEQAILLFYHSRHAQSGRLIKDRDKQYVLTNIPGH